jgi:hypothetical protein
VRDDAAVRAVLVASAGASTEEEIASRTGCGAALAFRAWVIRRAASGELLSYWADGLLTLRQVERIALADPFDPDAQRDAAADCSAVIRVRNRAQ